MLDYQKILDEAHAAAAAAQAGMVENQMALNCGFAWVTVDGTDGLARYCRNAIKAAGGEHKAPRGLGSKGYPRGWQFWKPGSFNGQQVDIHEAGAHAFRDKLAEYGIRAEAGSRLD